MRIGADQSEQPVRMVRLRGPDLVARHDIMVAVAHGAGPQAGEVGARDGFRKTLRPNMLGRAQEREIMVLLRMGDIGVANRPHQLLAHDEQDRSDRQSEERRVGQELAVRFMNRWWRSHYKKKIKKK